MTPEEQRIYYQNNKEKWEIYNSDKEKKNKLSRESYYRNKEKRKQNNIDWALNNYEKSIYLQTKGRCRRSGLEFTIELEDIIIPEYCPYLNIPLTRIWGQGRVDSNASIDRIDNTKGYTKGNIQIISFKANLLKRNATIQELITFAEGILKVHRC